MPPHHADSQPTRIIDLFAGAGGWDLGAHHIGNAVPPLLAAHVLAAASGHAPPTATVTTSGPPLRPETGEAKL